MYVLNQAKPLSMKGSFYVDEKLIRTLVKIGFFFKGGGHKTFQVYTKKFRRANSHTPL